ncbi:hypothetical protein [Arthrobacter sp. AQ5-05]|uniref:hypothetical protein n=1 Tax=Arthrobacter sp. AQ5-05 TaxID=2184581 RepID=UPI0018A796A7|nr:hypothetical protein [Arthrobacter sp. AQ5-05]
MAGIISAGDTSRSMEQASHVHERRGRAGVWADELLIFARNGSPAENCWQDASIITERTHRCISVPEEGVT